MVAKSNYSIWNPLLILYTSYKHPISTYIEAQELAQVPKNTAQILVSAP